MSPSDASGAPAVASSDPAGAAPSAGFRRLVVTTLVATFALVLVGGVVRLSDSGLGCGPAGSGFHGWPMCRGDIVPGVELNAIVEYSHRALAAACGLLMIALAAWAWRRLRGTHRGIVRATTAGLGLIVAQGLLGAATVELNLDEALVAVHLGLAMLLLGLLLYVWRSARPPDADDNAGGATAGPALRRLSVAAAALVLVTIMAGGYMAGTQKHGRTDHVPGAGAHRACGTDFPACNGSLMPFGQSELADIHLTHRAFMYLAVILVVALAVAVLRRRPGRAAVRLAWGALGILVVQVLLGAVNVWLPEEYELLVLVHLTAGTLLWVSVVDLGLALRPAHQAAGAAGAGRRDAARRGEPVPA
ncbi:MAG TPA: COX15/CtaA family protein [Thermoleophilaceae bacterium]|nr:COX15/CtaA family protein [Thermoleophilaceae bacterium]